MSALTRWNPFHEMEEMQRRLSSLIDLGSARRNLANEEESIVLSEWTPPVDVVEDDKEYLVKVELPGIARDAVKVTTENGTLTIAGERKSESEAKGRKFHRMECNYGRFERSFALPDDADSNKVQAEFKEGVLRVHVAKCEKARPKQIEVKVG